MSTLVVLAPMFKLTGAQKEPPRISRPVGPGALFIERDFVVLGVAPGPPQVNGTVIAPPFTDAEGSTAAGSIGAGTYYVTTTLLNGSGETTVGSVQEIVLGSTGEIIVESPAGNIGDATGYRIYIGTVLGTYHLQGSTVAIGTNTTVTTYSSGGAAPPSTNGTGLAAPSAPTLSAGGTTGPAQARTEYVIVTYVNSAGETVGSPESSQALTSGQLLTVTSPGASGDAEYYNVYASTVSGQEVRQNATPIALGTNWTEPTTGLVTQGVQRAVANQPGLINGLPCIVGMADHDYNANYVGPVGGAQPGGVTPFGRPAFNKSSLGVTEGYPMISTEPANAHIIAANAVQFEIALKQAWDPGFAGLLGGLAIDAGSGYFVFDLTASNQIAQLVEPVDGPGYGGPGDINKRVAIKFLGQYVTPN